ncbi:Regulator of nonsense transcripts 3B [Branchiostoma belcheri]|nr:Regulator of nonsense transcripts 3B [Branchiostoma belcheri]
MTKDRGEEGDKTGKTHVKESRSKEGAKKKKEEGIPTKVVIRRLPPTLTEETLVDELGPLPDHDFFLFVAADMSLVPHAFCRAYINFKNPEDIIGFKDKFDGYIFNDTSSKKVEYPAIVEFAPYQKVPKGRSKKKDTKCATIEQDPDYLKFLESLKSDNAGDAPPANIESLLEEIEARDRKKEETKMTTPLLDFIKNRRAAAARAREEAREERRRKEEERRRRREEERRKLTEEPRKGEGPERHGETQAKDLKRDRTPPRKDDRQESARERRDRERRERRDKERERRDRDTREDRDPDRDYGKNVTKDSGDRKEATKDDKEREKERQRQREKERERQRQRERERKQRQQWEKEERERKKRQEREKEKKRNSSEKTDAEQKTDDKEQPEARHVQERRLSTESDTSRKSDATEKGRGAKGGEDDGERELTKEEARAERRRLRNKDRPTMQLYRPGARRRQQDTGKGKNMEETSKDSPREKAEDNKQEE